MRKLNFIFIVFLVFSGSVYSATIVVNTNNLTVEDDDGLCTLNEAIDAVNNNVASGVSVGECIAGDAMPTIDIIEFDLNEDFWPAIFTTFAPIELIESIEIRGPGRNPMYLTNTTGIQPAFVIGGFTADASYTIKDMTILGNRLLSGFGYTYGGALSAFLLPTSSLTLERLKFLNNTTDAGGGGAIGLFGGTINGSVLIKDCTFEGNSASNISSGTIFNIAGGGAIFIGAGFDVTIQNSTFSNNFVENMALAQPLSDAAGGAILMRSPQTSPATLVIENSTFSNNHATGVGGAIATGGPGFPLEYSEVTIRHSTITLNTADSNDDQLTDNGGGGIYSGSFASLNLFNSIVALNTDNSNHVANDLTGSIVSFGYNFISDNSGSPQFTPGIPNANNDWVGALFAPLHPELEPLADNGGPTMTHVPMVSSQVLDQGKCDSSLTDQRYNQDVALNTRAVDLANINNAATGCDIGAVELGSNSENALPFAVDDDYAILEGQTLVVLAIDGLLSNDQDTDPLIVNNPGIISLSNGGLSGEAIVDIDGSLQFQADDADANGSVSFTYEVTDQYNSDFGLVDITVTAVNDAPSFVPALININTSANTIYNHPAWANLISAGPANEASQSLNFMISTTTPSFFSAVPTIDATTGDLEFTTDANATGIAELVIKLQDSGGTANGGINESDIVVLKISIVDNNDLIFKDSFE